MGRIRKYKPALKTQSLDKLWPKESIKALQSIKKKKQATEKKHKKALGWF